MVQVENYHESNLCDINVLVYFHMPPGWSSAQSKSVETDLESGQSAMEKVQWRYNTMVAFKYRYSLHTVHRLVAIASRRYSTWSLTASCTAILSSIFLMLNSLSSRGLTLTPAPYISHKLTLPLLQHYCLEYVIATPLPNKCACNLIYTRA